MTASSSEALQETAKKGIYIPPRFPEKAAAPFPKKRPSDAQEQPALVSKTATGSKAARGSKAAAVFKAARGRRKASKVAQDSKAHQEAGSESEANHEAAQEETFGVEASDLETEDQVPGKTDEPGVNMEGPLPVESDFLCLDPGKKEIKVNLDEIDPKGRGAQKPEENLKILVCSNCQHTGFFSYVTRAAYPMFSYDIWRLVCRSCGCEV
jgi:hypothetical protein